jgi:hypothetical protein
VVVVECVCVGGGGEGEGAQLSNLQCHKMVCIAVYKTYCLAKPQFLICSSYWYDTWTQACKCTHGAPAAVPVGVAGRTASTSPDTASRGFVISCVSVSISQP